MIVYNQKLAGYLMLNGFVLQGIDKDKKNPNYNVFHFKDSDELTNKINDYKLQLNK